MKYLLLKHYRARWSGPDRRPAADGPLDAGGGRRPHAVHARLRRPPRGTGEFVDGQALAPDGAFVRSDGEGRPPVVDGPFAETKDLIAGWMIIDVESWDRAVELAGELSAAPGPGGEPIHEWLEVRPFLTAAATISE